MVSTRQSSNVGSSADAVVSAGTPPSSDASHSTVHAPGKLLRSGVFAPPPPPALSMPSTSTQNDPIVSQPSTSTATSSLNLLDLPYEVLDKIFAFLGYKHVAHLRPVCRQLDKICQAILNSTFQRLQHQMLTRFQSIKAKMPRRESARRNHPLACESDIIETLHMRLTLLQMTFGKHIERKHCCFFAGEILDEVNRILLYVKITPKLARPYKVTDELFDLSTMAMEFFKEHIEPTLPEIAYFGSDFIDFSFPGNSPSNKYFTLDSPSHGRKGYEGPANGNDAAPMDHRHAAPQSNVVLRKRIKKIKQGMRRYNNQLIVMRRDLRSCKSKIADHKKQIQEYASRMEEYDKKNEETSRKFSTLLQELNKCKTELQYWRSKTPVIPPLCNNCGHSSAIPGKSEEEQLAPNAEPASNGNETSLTQNSSLEPMEFPGETSANKDEDFWNLSDGKKEAKPYQMPSPSDQKMQEATKLGKGKEDKASPSKVTPESSKNMKRKLAEEESADNNNKKPKRALKIRCASKRVKA